METRIQIKCRACGSSEIGNDDMLNCSRCGFQIGRNQSVNGLHEPQLKVHICNLAEQAANGISALTQLNAMQPEQVRKVIEDCLRPVKPNDARAALAALNFFSHHTPLLKGADGKVI